MKKLKYLLLRFKRMDFARLFRTIKETSRKSGKGRIYIALDMLGCALKYMAAPADYALFEFYKLTPDQRKTYVTRGINNDFIKKMNDPKKVYLLDNKGAFNQRFKDYIKREYLVVTGENQAAFESFVTRQEQFIMKPLDQSCGVGIQKLNVKDFESTAALYAHISTNGKMLVEEVLKQHEKMASLHPKSINTLRLATVTVKGETEIIYGFIRIGNGYVVDNLNNGGMAAPIDVKTGEVLYPAADKNYLTYTHHPATGVAIVGFVPPLFEMAVAMVKEAAQLCEGLGYVGWDVAITPDGPCLVEGNAFPGHDILQLTPHVPNRIGLKARFEKYL